MVSHELGLKKGPWTPDEDIKLISYVEQHGPGNWRAVPRNTGLLRCSKSCRLRWTNYLRPGIKRGGFTEHEERMIIHLQALLGNRWAAIASYLPQRTDNDIKNYWNTHLKKRLKKREEGGGRVHSRHVSRGQWEQRLQADVQKAKTALFDALSIDDDGKKGKFGSIYASSADNIARLLEGWWKKDSPSVELAKSQECCELGGYEGLPWVVSGVCSEAFHSSSSDTSECALSHPGVVKDGNTPDVAAMSLLEKWLLDEGCDPVKDDIFSASMACDISVFK